MNIELNTKTDVELYKDFLKGNNESFNLIAKRYRNQLILFIMKYIQNYEIAEDLAQDVFLYILINKKEYDFKYSMKTYLYTIAKSRAINYIQRTKRNMFLSEIHDIQNEKFDIDEKLLESEQRQKILDAIKQLKQQYQIAIYLKDFQNFQYKEISKILNKTMPQVKMLIYRARKSLKKVLNEGGIKNV